MCLVGGVVANDLANSTITSTQAWVIANGTDHSTITVTAVDSNGKYQAGVPVSFSLASNSVALGTLSASSSSTASNGVASTTFTANKTSGSATIKINLTFNGQFTNLVYVQQIDHDTPFYWMVTSSSQASVGTETYFNVSYTDQWGNVIDHRNPADPYTISLQIGSVAGNAAFDTGTFVISTSQQLDGYGNLSVKVRLDTVAGQNNIYIQPFGAIQGVYPAIIGISNGIPVSMTQTVSPNPPVVPADNAHQISILYTLYDKYGNPTVGQNISVYSSVGDSYPNLTTNGFGQVGLTYGPQGIAQNITLYATATANSSVTSSENVTFYSTAPVNCALSADPQTMASLDANPYSTANVTAQVTDGYGNPVSGQQVTFKLGTPSYDLTTDNITAQPKLSSLSAQTDSNGNAIVQFIPGGFSNATLTPYYNPLATGTCPVTATWNGTTQNVVLTWKNYPYLSAYTSVSPPMVAVNGTVNVTVKLTGDGWALQPNPIDAVLLMDRSGSMSTMMSNGKTEMQNAQAGAETFGALLNRTNDRLAIVSFSGVDGSGANQYNIDTTVGSLTTNHVTINNTISGLVANGGTGTRDGIYQSITLLKNNPNSNPKAVRAVILLTDGDYNWLGDFLGRGTAYSPAPPTGYTGYSTNALEPQKYLYYNGLGSGLIPAASFSGTTPTKGYVQFTDSSIGSPTSWVWNFGDSNTTGNTLQNPLHYYPYSSTAKTYTVTLNATNPYGSNTVTATNYVQVAAGSSGKTGTVTFGTAPSAPTYTTGPDAQLTDQNMTKFALDNNIRVYAISYYNTFTPQAITDMTVMANATGGFYANAPNAATLALIYNEIAGNLQTAAGVNTQMNLNFQNVNLTGVTVPGAQALSYVPTTQITWQDNVTNYTDQSSQWNANQQLSFNIGTINLGQTWQATFELMVKQAGSIQLFGNQSTVTFNNGTSSLTIPPVFITVNPNLTAGYGTQQSILLSPLLVTQSGIITDFVPLQWTITYPGITGLYTATERLYYSTTYQDPGTCGGPMWVGPFSTITGIPVGGPWTQSSTLDVRALPAGTYYICVDASAQDAYTANVETGTSTMVKTSGKSYIQLQ
ncbi:MAG: Ig-like domain-containing protein [Methanoregula sp.]